MDVQYSVTGFPFAVAESFMDLFEGLTYTEADFALPEPLRDQDNEFWSMDSSFYKYGLSGSNNMSYDPSHSYELNDHSHRTENIRRSWERSSRTVGEVASSVVPGNEFIEINSHPQSEECIRTHQNASISEVGWQDNIDSDNMTYEELLDLGEVIGTQNRGLPQELISSLPVSKCKWRFFSRRKKIFDRCVVCQMEFKRGDKQMTLPCKHVYHAHCVSKWLSINKACPICYIEVFKKASKQ